MKYLKVLNELNSSNVSLRDPLDNLRSILYHLETSDVPNFPKFLALDFFAVSHSKMALDNLGLISFIIVSFKAFTWEVTSHYHNKD